jgi:ligand-binding sensor domain-containing protein/tRNA A-37 threonylcarbamoyl transferase component Bud32
MDNLQPGQTLGPYRIIGQIGQGGMATVFKAYHAAMDRYVALKILPRQLAENPEFLGRFRQEARIIANLEHPHILPVHDYGESEGFTYLVMRYLDTGTLKDRLHARPLLLPEVDRAFSQLADALEYAHAHGVIHRDLKPSNVLVDARGNLFLTDFGIAKLLESSPQFTGTGALIGTPDYMSPEQAQGLKVDQRTDIYSLGIILYEMVTGRVPFEAETPLAVILKHLNDPLPLPTSIKPDLSPAIERVLLKALAKAPDDRFASVAELHEAWKKALAEVTTLHAPPPAETIPLVGPVPPPGPAAVAPPHAAAPLPPAPAPPARRRLPWGWIVAVGVVLVLAVCGGLVLLQIVPRFLASGLGEPSPSPAATRVSTAPVAQTPPVGAALAQWTSWVGANHLWSVVVNGDEIIAGGRGLTIWNRNTGALVRRYMGPPDGLPDVFINAILVGEGGALWVGTYDGVGFFDGKRWKKYGEDDGLDSTAVSALAWLPDGLLAGTQYCGVDGGGLNLFAADGVKHVDGFPSVADDQPGTLSSNVTALLTIPDQQIWWVGTMRGLARFDGKERKWTLYFQADGLPNETITALWLDDEGVLWAGTEGGAAKFDGARFESVDRLKDYTVVGMVQDGEGRYWFSGSGGLARFDPAADDWQVYTQDDGLPSYDYYGAARDADDAVYFGSDDGLVRYADNKFTTWAMPNEPAYGRFGKILPAPDGDALWFVELYGGPHPDRFDLRAGTWSTVGGLPEACNPLAIDADKAVWCGGGEGLWRLAAAGSQARLTTEQGLPSNRVTAVAFPASAKGEVWVGTEDKGVALFDGRKITQVFDTGHGNLTGDSIHALLAASDGSLWVGTDKGVDRLGPDGAWEHFSTGHPFTENLSYVTDLAEAADGAIWVSTDGECECVHRFAEGKWQLLSNGDPGVKLPRGTIVVITPMPDGSVWFGGYYSGAARFDGKTWTLFRTQDGLIHPSVTDIYQDKDGVVWFATEGGVTRYVP